MRQRWWPARGTLTRDWLWQPGAELQRMPSVVGAGAHAETGKPLFREGGVVDWWAVVAVEVVGRWDAGSWKLGSWAGAMV